MPSLILKMRLQSVTRHAGTDTSQAEYTLLAVYGAGNETWSKFTPSGCLKFTVTNPDAPELVLGAEYLIELKPVAVTGL
jgi:hypothetical protein